MKKNLLRAFVLGAAAFLGVTLSACGGGGQSYSETSASKPGGHNQDEVDAYMERLKTTSEADHFYYHYLRYDSNPLNYNNWDVWVWPYRPTEGQGAKFDWVGRSQGSDALKTASGNATVDEFGYACIDIDLTKTDYDGGWDNTEKVIGGTPVNFGVNHTAENADEERIGLQIVKTSTRADSGFWTNDGSNLYVKVADYALTDEERGVTSYHAFVTEGMVQSVAATPAVNPVDPFEDDDGTNETYNNPAYNDVDYGKLSPVMDTSPDFLKGGDILSEGAGVGYQIMVSSFADSDGDGFGDIYGITQKLDYLKDLGVNVLWLTPVQKSDSYHGYDITDYLSIDEKFGSSMSTASKDVYGMVTSDTAKADYKELIDEAHARGMAVIMDLVINHTSTGNKWFVDGAQLDETLRGYYRWANHDTGDGIDIEHCWYPYGETVYSYYAKFGSSMPELNYSYTGTRQAVEAIALNWCEFGVDGFRMDAVKHIYMEDEVAQDSDSLAQIKKSDTFIKDVTAEGENYSSDLTRNLHFWRELNYAIKSQYPNAFIVGENFDGHAYHVAPYYEGFDSMFDFYSYFNLTSLAARGRLNGSSGAYSGTASAYLGATDNGSPYSADSDATLDGNVGASISHGGYWNLRSVMSAYNQYRGDSAMPKTGAAEYSAIVGSFTSNHDIARSINRIAGTSFNGDGLTAQGNVTTVNYAEMDELATCVQIAQLMLPGLTWIYYGDELGMTGNFPAGADEDTDYADLYYRQPMKWEDENTITHYNVNGSSFGVSMDDINGSDLVAPAETQQADPASHYSAIKAFATAKNSEPALIRGNFVPWGWNGNDYILNFQRILGNDTFHVFVNLSNSDALFGTAGEVVASFNGAGQSSGTNRTLPSHSAVLIKE